MVKKALKYGEAISELNAILRDLESERIDVDEVSAKVKKAVEIIQLCRQKIEATELEVNKLVKEFEKDSESK